MTSESENPQTNDREKITTSARCPACGEVAPVRGYLGETKGFHCISCDEPFEVTFR